MSPYAWNKPLAADKDIFKSNAQILVNPVNCVGVMGKGLAKQFREKFPALYEDYKSACKHKVLKPGYSMLYHDAGTNQWVANLATEDHWKNGASEHWISQSLRNLRDDIARTRGYFHPERFESVAIPRIGCGLGGLDWNNIRPLIINELKGCRFDVWLDGELFLRNEKGVNMMENPVTKSRTTVTVARTDRRFQWDKQVVADKDIFQSGAQVLVNPVNCVGAMGKGLALSFKQKFPAVNTAYVVDCNNGRYKPGDCRLYYADNGVWIANIASKDHWKNPSQKEWVIQGVQNLFREMHRLEGFGKDDVFHSVAIPKIGCGLGGLNWDEIRPAILKACDGQPYDIWLDGHVLSKDKTRAGGNSQTNTAADVPVAQQSDWRSLPVTEKQKSFIKAAEAGYRKFTGKTRGEASDYLTEFKKRNRSRNPARTAGPQDGNSL